MENTEQKQNQGKTIEGKRKNERLEEQRIKRQNLENNDDLPTETKITDLDPDCLEHILMYLDLKYILTVADSNKYLKSVAERAFVRKYKFNSNLNIRIMTSLCVSFSLISCRDRLTDDLKTCFQIVRCFGHLVKHLNFHFHPKIVPISTKIYERILNYVNEYCINVESIDIKGITILDKFQKPFSKVQRVYLEGCSLGPNSIDWLFPNMISLKHKAVNGNFMDIEKHMPKLDILTIGVSHGRLINSCEKTIETACRLNPQLKHFNVYMGSGLNMQLLANLSKYLQSLEELTIHVNSKEDSSYEGDTIHFKSLNKFEIDLNLKINELFPKIPFSFDRLKNLAISTNCQRYSDELFKFISNNPTIDTLTFVHYMYENLTKIVSVLPALETIVFYGEYSFEQVCNFLAEFKLLNTFKFILKDENNLKDLQARFGNEWKIRQILVLNFIEMERIKRSI